MPAGSTAVQLRAEECLDAGDRDSRLSFARPCQHHRATTLKHYCSASFAHASAGTQTCRRTRAH
eukprot:14676465-Alexandrium_andersonii.AAC.1